MTALELLSQLRAKGVEVKTAGDDRLVIDAPKGTISEELRTSLAAHKGELLQILKGESIPATPRVEKTAPLRVTRPVAPPAAFPSAPDPESQAIASSTAEEVSQLHVELTRLRSEEEARRSEVETARVAAESALRVEQERWRQEEEEIARRRAERERQRIDAEARERADEQKRQQIADQELARAENELAGMRSMEAARRQEVAAQVRAAIEAHENELASLRTAEEAQTGRRAEEERRFLEAEARKRAQEDELRRRAEMRFRAVEEEIERVQAREHARVKASHDAQRLAEEAEQKRSDEDARRRAAALAQSRAEEEARLRAEIEAQMRAEAEERRRAEDQTRRRAEEEARRRAEEQVQLLAAERTRRLAEEEAQRRAEEAARRKAAEETRLRAEEEARRQAEAETVLRAEREERERAEATVRERAQLEARIRSEVEAKLRAEEAERRDAERRRAEHERMLAEEEATPVKTDFPFEIGRIETEHSDSAPDSKVTDIAEWFDVDVEDQSEARAPRQSESFARDSFAPGDDHGNEFRPVSVPDEDAESGDARVSPALAHQLSSSKPAERAAALAELPKVGGEDSFRRISAAFDDQSAEVRSAAARALFDLQEDRAAAFTRALREASQERRRRIGSAIGSSGLAGEAIRNLTGESRDKTYDAFSLLFLMSKAGEVQPLMRSIEEHPNIEVRLAVVKLLALSGQPDILPAFRRMAVRGSLPPEVRSAVMEAIYQITSQTPAEAGTIQ